MTVAAIEQAITFLSRADLISSARQQSLPDKVTEILKISSGDEAALLSAQESSRVSREDVIHAAQFYVQQILFAPDSDHYRVLGVDPDDAEAKIKLHYRLLVRWLHPDKNSSDWEVIFSDRVNRAWHAIRTPERRREYDAQLEALSVYPSSALQPSREVTPAQLRQSQSDQRFLSSRTIKRLPVAMFGLLGVSAVFALWWFSQLQPRVDTPLVVRIEPQIVATESLAPDVMIEKVEPSPSAAIMEAKVSPAIESASVKIPPTSPDKINPALELASQELKPVEKIASQDIKPVEKIATNGVKQTKVMTPGNKQSPAAAKPMAAPVALVIKKPMVENKPESAKARPAPMLAGKEIRTAKPSEQKSKASTKRHDVAPTKLAIVKADVVAADGNNAPVGNPEVVAANQYDAEVKKLLQQFSRVYAEGNYFALHDLFTSDLRIIGAPSQRKVLHGYRQLFKSSQQREIAIQNVTWLESDKNITVMANFQSQVLPLGGNEAEASHGNIRLVLRMENGELKIIRLQADTKNG